MDISSRIKKYDNSDMFKTLSDFRDQIAEAIKIGKNSQGFSSDDEILDLLVLGMGGSAIGGEILRSFCCKTVGLDHINIRVNRNYEIPRTIDSNTFVISSSYSGGTEETISGFRYALKKTKKLVSITTGGDLAGLSKTNNVPIIDIPSGMMPRCAIAYSFFPMLFQVLKSIGIKNETFIEVESAIDEIGELIERKSKLYSDVNDNNPAVKIAKKLYGKMTVVYSSDILDAVNLRWRGQIQENAKAVAFGNILPEMNHNEINSFLNPNEITDHTAYILLVDKLEHEKTKRRFEAIADLLGKDKTMIILSGEGEYLLTRIFDQIYLADWVSYYLAILYGEDPTPIPMISKLKDLLSK